MDQSQIQQQLLADTPLDKLQLSFTETCELLLQQNTDILKDLDEGFSQDGIAMKSAKRLHLKADDQALHITLDLVTPKEPFYGQQTYLLFSVQDALTNIKQLLVQHDKEYYRQVYNEATDSQADAPEKIVDEPANKRIMISAVMRLNSVEPVHEDMMMLQLPHITVPPSPDTAVHTSSDASATKKHGKDHEQSESSNHHEDHHDDHHESSHDTSDVPMARVLDVELPEPSEVMGESYGHQANDASLHDLPSQPGQFSMPADLPVEPPQPQPLNPGPDMSQQPINVPPAFANPPQYPQPMQQPPAPVPQAMPMPQAPVYQPPPPMPAPPRQSNDMYQPPPQTISPTVPPQPNYGPPQMPQQPYGNPMQQPMQPPMPPQQGLPPNQQRGGFYQLPQ